MREDVEYTKLVRKYSRQETLAKAVEHAVKEYIQNIQQLFLMFQVNLDQLEEYRTLFYNDKVQSRNLSGEVDLIKLKTLTVNIVSAGKTLIEQIEVVTKKYLLDDKVDFKKHFISKKYDENFSYRFMYSQSDFR